MAMRSDRETWGAVARGLHWLSALVIGFGLAHGYWMANLLQPREARLPHYVFHSAVMLYLGLLIALRIVWRIGEPTPELPAGTARWERIVAHAAHTALYVLVIAVLITGFMNWSAFPARFNPQRAADMVIRLFGFWPVPAVHDTLSRDVFKFWEEGHRLLSFGLAGLVAAHVAAALRHAVGKRNGVMRRMWSGRPL